MESPVASPRKSEAGAAPVTILGLSQWHPNLCNYRSLHDRKLASAADIQGLIEKYTVGLDPLPPTTGTDSVMEGPLIILLTGSTGNLGSEILVHLLKSDRVERVITFNRPSRSGVSIEQRHGQVFLERDLDIDVLKSKKLTHVLADASKPKLGLDDKQYLFLSKSVNVVIHNAWRLSFTATLSDFEPNIRATRHLVDFLRSGPHAARARIFFSSSNSTGQAWPPSKGFYPEEIVDDPSFAVGRGYGASKYILAKSGLQMTSIRIGQLNGSASKGAWETTEWVPVLVKSCITLGSFPDIKGAITWIAMDAAAAAIAEAVLRPEALPRTLNLVNPHSTDINILVAYLLAAMWKFLGKHLNVVPMNQWLAKLEECAVNATTDMVKEIVNHFYIFAHFY
ncbi:hypothetical protein H0H93_012863 [Arthromyces matolae]|nr:hypothetical protein H0H93_012863 [Arthromyces matolae]